MVRPRKSNPRSPALQSSALPTEIILRRSTDVLDCEQSLFFFRFSKGSAPARERWAAKPRDAKNEGGLSRLAPSITRLVICVSRALCSTDQEKRETARSLPMFRYVEVLFYIFYYDWGKKTFVIPRTSLYRGSLYRGSTLLVRFESIGQFWRSTCWYDPWWC